MSPPGNFIYPFYLQTGSALYTSDLIWTIGSNQTLEWNTTLTDYDLTLYHQDLSVPGGSGIQATILNSYGADGAGVVQYTWTVQTYGVDTSESPVFFFWINPSPSDGVSSSYFNVTDASISTPSSTSLSSSSKLGVTTSSTTAISTKTSTTISSTSSSADTTAPSFTTPSSVSSSSPSGSPSSVSSSSSALPIGLGVGLGLGIPLILLIGVWLGMTAMKQRRNAAAGPTPDKQEMSPGSKPLPPYSSDIKTNAHGQDYYAPTSSEPYSYSAHEAGPHEAGPHEAPSNELYEAPDKSTRSPVELG